MFISIRRRSVVVLVLFVVIVSFTCFAVSAVTLAGGMPKNGLTIVVDAGHGGRDGGVKGVSSSIIEADINLAIAKNLKYFLLDYGYDVVLTRTGTDGLYGLTSSNKKMDDMRKRKEIIEKASPDLVISIHQNFFPLASVRGAQAFYAPTSEQGKRMADTMQSVLNANLEATNKASAKGDYYILQCTQFPSLLIECGFLSNLEDERLLISASYQEKVAYTIFSAINVILQSNQDN